MFARVSAVFVLVFITLIASVSALPAAVAGGGPGGYGGGGSEVNQCNTGTIQCCNSVRKASTVSHSGLLGGLLGGLDLSSISGLVGLHCNSITGLVGVGGNNCNAQAACCTGNSFNGLIVLGCSPINL